MLARDGPRGEPIATPSICRCIILLKLNSTEEVVQICANALYDGEITSPPFPRAVFVELMQTATSSVEFSFSNIMHRQIDGVAMGSPLGPSLANIFVGYYEALLFKRVNKPFMYYRYVDDTFAVFNDEDECNEFFSHLSIHRFVSLLKRNAIGLCPFLTSW